MKVFCPTCGTGYLLPENRVPKKPRLLICPNCNSSWKHDFQFNLKSQHNVRSSSNFNKSNQSNLGNRPNYSESVLKILREEAQLEAKLRN